VAGDTLRGTGDATGGGGVVVVVEGASVVGASVEVDVDDSATVVEVDVGALVLVGGSWSTAGTDSPP
jgi:hypothetical protein